MVKINGSNPIQPTGQVAKSQRPQMVKKTDTAEASDRVQFSDVLKDVQSVGETDQTDKAERQARVQELKEQIANGSYSPDMHKVSASLLRFLVEGQ